MLNALFDALFPSPEPQEFESILGLETTGKPNEAFLLPRDVIAKDANSAHKLITCPAFSLSREELFDIAASYLKTQQGSETVWYSNADFKAVFCVRSKLMRYPDMVYIEALESGSSNKSILQGYSHSVVGYSDLGVNAKRLSGLRDALQSYAIDTNFA